MHEQLKLLSLPFLPNLGLLQDPTASPQATPPTDRKSALLGSLPSADISVVNVETQENTPLRRSCSQNDCSTLVNTVSAEKKTEFASSSALYNPRTGHHVSSKVKDRGDSEWTVVDRKPKNQPGGNTGSQNKSDTKTQRDNCLIFIRVPESTKNLPEERMNDDCLFLQKCVSKLFDAGEPGLRIITAFRLGKKSENIAANPRPLKVVLESKEECLRVLNRTSRLKGEPYFIVRDLSPEDRIRMKTALQELKCRREAGETNLKIVDFRVVRIAPKARWKPVVLLPHLLQQVIH